MNIVHCMLYIEQWTLLTVYTEHEHCTLNTEHWTAKDNTLGSIDCCRALVVWSWSWSWSWSWINPLGRTWRTPRPSVGGARSWPGSPVGGGGGLGRVKWRRHSVRSSEDDIKSGQVKTKLSQVKWRQHYVRYSEDDIKSWKIKTSLKWNIGIFCRCFKWFSRRSVFSLFLAQQAGSIWQYDKGGVRGHC